jgi:DNA polymerase sigma
MLKVSRLNDPYTGGISSYALLLMIVAFLQSKGLMKKMDNQTNLGKILLEFLMFYGNGFNQSAQGI